MLAVRMAGVASLTVLMRKSQYSGYSRGSPVSISFCIYAIAFGLCLGVIALASHLSDRTPIVAMFSPIELVQRKEAAYELSGSAIDANGRTALAHAEERGLRRIQEVLRRCGAA